jgi:voltage-gated potassium channel
MFNDLKHQLYELMEVPAYKNNTGWYYEFFMMGLILLNGIAMIIGTVDWIQLQYDWILLPFEIVSVLIFSIEYIILLWVCTEHKEYSDPIWGRIKYAMTPIAIINLVSVLPAFVPFLLPIDLRSLRLFRLFRMIRLLKLTKYSDSLKTLLKVLDSRKEQLIMTCLITAFLVLIAAIFMFYAETGENSSPAFSDIPHTIWWSFVKLSPISTEPGAPVTMNGKVILSLLAIIEIGIFAIPAGIMAGAFEEQWKADKKNNKRQLTECKTELKQVLNGICPHCKQPFDDPPHDN